MEVKMIDYTNSEVVKNELYDSFTDSLTSVEEYNFKLAIIADVNNYFHKFGMPACSKHLHI